MHPCCPVVVPAQRIGAQQAPDPTNSSVGVGASDRLGARERTTRSLIDCPQPSALCIAHSSSTFSRIRASARAVAIWQSFVGRTCSVWSKPHVGSRSPTQLARPRQGEASPDALLNSVSPASWQSWPDPRLSEQQGEEAEPCLRAEATGWIRIFIHGPPLSRVPSSDGRTTLVSPLPSLSTSSTGTGRCRPTRHFQ